MTDHDSLTDRPGAVRPGEELDRARLAAFLAARFPGAGEPEIAQFPGGMSNLTYLVRSGDREFVLRRPPFGVKGRGSHDMGREHHILAALSAAGYAVPQPVVLVEDASVLGAPFYLMERVHGVILRNPPPAGLALGPKNMRSVCLALVDALAALHALDYAAAGLADLGRPEGYTARQVAGWTRRYEAARTALSDSPQTADQGPETADSRAAPSALSTQHSALSTQHSALSTQHSALPDFAPVAAWLAANLPPESPGALIHNDFRYDNVVLDPADLTRIVAILDWELATIGDPLTDLGTTLAYWAEPGDPAPLRAFGLTDRPGNLDRQGVIERYAERSGRDVSAMLFYYVYGLFKNGVIILQIYARYRQGHTRDPRFAGLLALLSAIADLAARAIATGRVSGLYA